MIEIIASAKFEACLILINNLFDYHPHFDTYIPKYGAVDGKVIRLFMDAVSGTTLARKGVSSTEYLVSAE